MVCQWVAGRDSNIQFYFLDSGKQRCNRDADARSTGTARALVRDSLRDADVARAAAAARRDTSRTPQTATLRLPVAVLSFGVVTGLSGCGAGGFFSQAAQTYNVTATGSSGTVQRSSTVALTVQ